MMRNRLIVIDFVENERFWIYNWITRERNRRTKRDEWKSGIFEIGK